MKKFAAVLFLYLAVCFPLLGDEREELTRALQKELQKYEGDIDFAVVASLLKAGADPNGRCESGRPFLAQVIQTHGGRQVTELTELLLDHGALVDTVNEKGETILWAMVDREHNERIDILLRRGANPNKQNASGDTPLMAAHTDAMTAALLAHGANPNLQNNDGDTALMHSNVNFFRNTEFLNLLLEAGADPTIKNNKGQTVLHRRIYMLDNEALLDSLISRGCFIDEPDLEGYTPLMLAASGYSFHDRIITALLKKGADPNLSGPMGRSALHLYLLDVEYLNRIFYREENYIPPAEALLAAGALPAKKDKKGDSALASAMRLSLRYKEMRPLGDLVSQYASAGEISEAKKAAAKTVGAEKNNKLSKSLSAGLPPTLIALLFPLVIGGLSIFMREKRHAADKSKNLIMGRANGILVLGAIGLYVGFMKGVAGYQSSGDAWANMFDGLFALGYGLAGGCVGIIAGAGLACLPPVRKAFTNYSVLYYLATALSVIAAGVFIFHIWRY